MAQVRPQIYKLKADVYKMQLGKRAIPGVYKIS